MRVPISEVRKPFPARHDTDNVPGFTFTHSFILAEVAVVSVFADVASHDTLTESMPVSTNSAHVSKKVSQR